MKRTLNKEILGWAMFDFANQAYTLLIITVVFGDLFTRVIVGDAEQNYRLGNLLWSVSLAVSYLAVVIVGPVCGAVMDFSASRKRFLFASYVVTVVTTAMLYFVAPGYVVLGMVLIVFSNFGYAIGESFIASFLPDLGPPEALGRISGFGWAFGYIGGLVSTAFALLFLGEVSAENFQNVRWVGPFAGGFFLVTAIPTFLWLKERGRPRRLARPTQYVALGVRRVRDTLATVGNHRDLAWLLGSVFFAMAGIYIVVAFTFIYGAQVVRQDERIRVVMFVVVQLTAAAGAAGLRLCSGSDRCETNVSGNVTDLAVGHPADLRDAQDCGRSERPVRGDRGTAVRVPGCRVPGRCVSGRHAVGGAYVGGAVRARS